MSLIALSQQTIRKRVDVKRVVEEESFAIKSRTNSFYQSLLISVLKAEDFPATHNNRAMRVRSYKRAGLSVKLTNFRRRTLMLYLSCEAPTCISVARTICQTPRKGLRVLPCPPGSTRVNAYELVMRCCMVEVTISICTISMHWSGPKIRARPAGQGGRKAPKSVERPTAAAAGIRGNSASDTEDQV
eukprot:4065247-Pleurochrysis_carterae.AAC.2